MSISLAENVNFSVFLIRPRDLWLMLMMKKNPMYRLILSFQVLVRTHYIKAQTGVWCVIQCSQQSRLKFLSGFPRVPGHFLWFAASHQTILISWNGCLAAEFKMSKYQCEIFLSCDEPPRAGCCMRTQLSQYLMSLFSCLHHVCSDILTHPLWVQTSLSV